MSTPSEQRIARLPAAMPLSRVLRALLGLLMAAAVMPALVAASWPGRGRVIMVVAALVVFYTIVHYVVGRWLGWVHPCVGAAIAILPAGAVFFQGGAYEIGAIAFVGLSLILMAALGHPGCEVLALPAVILGRRTHLACLLFSPLDWMEGKITGLVRRPRA